MQKRNLFNSNINNINDINNTINIDNSFSRLVNDIRNKSNINNNTEYCIIYLRSSSKEQNNDMNNQHSILTQQKLCVDYAKENNYIIVDIIKDIHRANDITKLKINNIPDNFNTIHLIVADPSRIARDYEDGVKFVKKCSNNNIIIHSVRDNAITNTSVGKRKIIDGIMIANDESDTFSKRIKSMIDVKKSLGSVFGVAPYGKQIVKEIVEHDGINYIINKFETNEIEQDIIQLIKYLYNGIEIDVFYELFHKIIGDNTVVLYYDGHPWSNIMYKECTFGYIAQLLNQYNILRRGNLWNANSVSKVYRNNISENDVFYQNQNNNNDDDDMDEDYDEDNNCNNYFNMINLNKQSFTPSKFNTPVKSSNFNTPINIHKNINNNNNNNNYTEMDLSDDDFDIQPISMKYVNQNSNINNVNNKNNNNNNNNINNNNINKNKTSKKVTKTKTNKKSNKKSKKNITKIMDGLNKFTNIMKKVITTFNNSSDSEYSSDNETSSSN